ncbi:YebC/PmpR family DNA-binding transcriptional regulator [Patescibacteria group bacterium]|nr:YebC/PmpR family DNA-binding transcriptional regulator [Patescibacteria group bacterium]
MSGHSKWATTHKQKALKDSKKSSVFSKYAKLITISARDKGGDLETNFNLRILVNKAKKENMPKDKIENAIKKGTGEIESEIIEELLYEAVGPYNTQFIIKCITDSRNRCAGDIRHILSKNGGNLSSVIWNFDYLSVLEIDLSENKIDYDKFELDLIDFYIKDIIVKNTSIIIYADFSKFSDIKNFLDSQNISISSEEIKYIPRSIVDLTTEELENVLKIKNILLDYEDVVEIWTNFSI